jgi:CubicO group peptidase (beta-lactamase class C family)
VKKMIFALLLSLSILCAHPAVAQQIVISRPDGKTLTTSLVDADVKKLMGPAEVTGLCLGIVNDNKPVYVKSYGYGNKAENRLNDTAACFCAASLAKPLFAYLVMQFVDKGVIDLDKPLFTYLQKPLPDYEYYKDLSGDDRWKLITARHCLSHTTGFPNWRDLNPRNNHKLEIFFTPGERYAYSGEGIYLLQFVLETIANRHLEDLAQENIFKPFGMTRTGFVWQPSFENDFAVGHTAAEDTLPKNRRTWASAAGSMETTIADYTRFLAAVMRGERLTQKSQQEMFSPQIGIYTKRQFPSLNNDTTSANKRIQLSYGLGWGLFKTPYGWAFFKEGHDDGWQHYCISFPDKRTSLIIMTNSSNGESVFKELVEDVSGVTIPWEWEGYAPYRASVSVPTATLGSYVGTYRMRADSSLTVTISRNKDRALARASFLREQLQFVFLSDTKFTFQHAIDVDGEFIIEPGEEVKFIIDDKVHGISEWIKVK